ncbi:MAG: hypothetical protein IT211_14550 [Armatimonadetes bacterium]|nr:hypothetical protein [Armatimonadota bacterium]
MNASATFCRLIALSGLLLPAALFAQTPPPPPAGDPSGGVPGSGVPGAPIFRFSGTSMANGESANRQGTGSEIPQRYARWEVTPTISLFGLPFGTHLMLSTEQDLTRQNINSLNMGFSLSAQQLQEQLKQRVYEQVESLMQNEDVAEVEGTISTIEGLTDPEALKDSVKKLVPAEAYDTYAKYKRLEKLQDLDGDEILSRSRELDAFGLISGAEKFMLNFPTLGVGVNYPEYTQLSLSGVPVNGVNIEFTPGKFYLALTGGKTQSEVVYDTAGQAQEAFHRELYAGRIGFGRKTGAHFYATVMYAADDPNPLVLDEFNTLTPKSNYVVGFETRIPLIPNYWTLDAEVLGSMLTGDRESARLQNSDIPTFITELVDPTISSFVDYALKGNMAVMIPESGTRLQAEAVRIGPGFQSLGAPNLRTDLFRYEGKAEQGIWRRQITVAGSFKQETDNLIEWKSATTTITAYGVGLGLNIRGIPYLRLNYNPYTQQSELSNDSLRATSFGDSQRVENRTGMWNATTGYNYTVAEISMNTNLSYSHQETRTRFGDGDNTANNYNFSQSFGFLFPLSLSASVGLNDQEMAFGGTPIITKTTTIEASGSYTLFDVWQSTLGVALATQKDTDDKTGFYLSTSFPVWVLGTMEIRAEKNIYKYTADPFAQQDYDELIFRASLNSTW